LRRKEIRREKKQRERKEKEEEMNFIGRGKERMIIQMDSE
jgi:hypothetical protein